MTMQLFAQAGIFVMTQGMTVYLNLRVGVEIMGEYLGINYLGEHSLSQGFHTGEYIKGFF